MRRPILGLLAVAIAACASAASEPPAAPEIHAQRLALGPGVPDGARVGGLRFQGALDLTSNDARFGGLSGLVVSPDGHALAVSDHGFFVDFDLAEDEEGRLVGVHGLRIEQMRKPGGEPLLRSRERDAEEVVVLPDGRRLVVFERDVRLGVFPPDSATAERFVPLPGLVPPTNRAIEAMVSLGGDRLLLIAEGEGESEGIRNAWVGRPGAWQRLSYVPANNDDVAGAALLPNGDLLVLERFFGGVLGFASRLTLVPGDAIGPGARLEGRLLLGLAPPLLADNFEGVAVRSTKRGTAIYLISDDNYIFVQRTLLLKFELIED